MRVWVWLEYRERGRLQAWRGGWEELNHVGSYCPENFTTRMRAAHLSATGRKQSLLFEITLSDAEDVYKPRGKITKQTHEAIQCFTLHYSLQYPCLEHSASPSVLLKLNLLLIGWSIKVTWPLNCNEHLHFCLHFNYCIYCLLHTCKRVSSDICLSF